MKRKIGKKWKTAGVVTAVAVATSAYFALTQAGDDSPGAPVFTSPVQVVTVERMKMGASVAVGGNVAAKDTVNLTAQMPGRVEFIAGDVGSRFKRGEILVALDDDALQAQLRSAYSARSSANSAWRNAGAQYGRELRSPQSQSTGIGGMGIPSIMDDMFANPMQSMMGTRDTGAVRYSDIVQRQTQMDQARNSMTQADAKIRQTQAKLRDTRSVAPFNGVISKKLVEVGDPVQPGMPLLEYSDTSSLKVEVHIPASLRGGVSVGQNIEVRFSSSRQPIVGRVIRIAPVADPVRHTIYMEIELPEHAPAEAGMYAEVRVPDPRTGAQAALVIPDSAVIEKGGLFYVFVVDSRNRAVLRLVRLGEPYSERHVTVLAGVSEGTRIVEQPPSGLRSGMSL